MNSTTVVPISEMSPKQMFKQFIAICDQLGLDSQWIRNVSLRTVDYYNAKAADRKQMAASYTQPNQWLQDQWYASVANGDPDYVTTYCSQEYMPEAWATWQCYSRGYVRSLVAPNQSKLLGRSVLDEIESTMGRVNSVLDAGCGLGYTSALLAEMTNAWVTGTQLGNSPQSSFATYLSNLYDFSIREEAEGHYDLIFASEYFEHFANPVDHLTHLIAVCSPHALLLANTFGPKSVGHFDLYEVDGAMLDGRKASKAFASALTELGYRKVKTGLWNERPQLWVRS